MADKSFIDTNVLIYAYSTQDYKKREVARRVLLRLEKEGTGCISTQVLQEFYVAATKKLSISADAAREIIQATSCFHLTQIDRSLLMKAIGISTDSQVSFWDAMIIAAAQSSGCVDLLTEDLQSGQYFGGLQVRNPFTEPA